LLFNHKISEIDDCFRDSKGPNNYPDEELYVVMEACKMVLKNSLYIAVQNLLTLKVGVKTTWRDIFNSFSY
jgi:hypothetical protein